MQLESCVSCSITIFTGTLVMFEVMFFDREIVPFSMSRATSVATDVSNYELVVSSVLGVWYNFEILVI